jgi:4-amino-4-deoxy-L-arabinose transferase-like glycosyltransferase
MKLQTAPASPPVVELAVAEPITGFRSWLAVGTLLVGFAVFHLLTLMRQPAPFVDEAWNANRAWALLHTGQAFGTLDAGVFDRYPDYGIYFPWLGTAIHAVGLALFGPDLFAVRIVSLVFGLVLLLAVYIIAARLYHHVTGLIATALVGLSNPFLISSHFGRHEIIDATFGFAAIALNVTDTGDRVSLRSVLCGLLAGLTLDIHFNGVIYGPVLLALYLFDYGWRILRVPRFWAFVAGGLIAAAFFLTIHILPNPQTYFTLFRLGNAAGAPPMLVPDAQLWWGAITNIFAPLDMRLPLLVAAVAVLIARRSRSDKKLLVVLSVLFLTFLLVVPTKALFYMIQVSPAMDLVLGAGLGILLQGRRTRSLWIMARIALVLGLLCAGVLRSLPPLLDNGMSDYRIVLDRIRQVVPAGSTVMGSQNYWFARPDQPYYSWEQLLYYRRFKPDSTLADALQAFHPDYFIFDQRVDLFIAEDLEALPPYLRALFISKSELSADLDEHARLILTMPTNQLGEIRVYKLTWK